MKLSVARAIHTRAQKTPLIRIYDERGDEFGRSATFELDGDTGHFYLQGDADGGEWWVAHCVYGGAYSKGATKKEAVVNFCNERAKWVLKEAKQRKLAAKIVAKYGIGPVVEQEGATWVARLNGEVVGKAANYSAAMKMGQRAEQEMK